ncbi:MAG: long-chain fatty acid--CoA ligase [Gammaproteobacteria bacterium]|nr:long-chain fatty acid--CoA ligase [Gammaproteobacteria bacterium]MDD9886399.1 long-chain fatty acid--CoA ligase [Gammaproteobacteria bacterium]
MDAISGGEPRISGRQAGTLCGLFAERVRLSGDAVAYRQFDALTGTWRHYTWRDMAALAASRRRVLAREALQAGERVAVMLPNGVDWVAFDQALLGMRLISVPAFSHDSAENVGYILANSGAKVLVADPVRLERLQSKPEILAPLQRIIVTGEPRQPPPRNAVAVPAAGEFTPGGDGDLDDVGAAPPVPGDVATIVYTSGTTGPAKGVVLTHGNLLGNVAATSDFVHYIGSDNLFLSFLPLSHTFERTVGYYLSMMIGAQVAYARSIQQLKEDLLTLRPTVLVSVPRIYEQVYNRLQAALEERPAYLRRVFDAAVAVGWRRSGSSPLALLCRLLWPLFDALVARDFRRNLGGRLRYALSGGAALPPDIGRTLTALGVPVYQGYGLTETGPVVSVNWPGGPADSIGVPIDGVEVRIGDNNELLTRSRYVMREYWGNPEATAHALDGEGWMHTGDQARMDEDGRLYIIGRLKEIIVMANGEKAPPADMEHALLADAWFAQAMVHGEGRPFLVALLVLADEVIERYPQDTEGLEAEAMKRVRARLSGSASYARVRRVVLLREPWTVDNGLLTPTLKLKRHRIAECYAEEIEGAYRGY